MFKQISVWLPNNPGVLSRFCDVLIKHNIEIRAVTVAENEEYGLLLLLVDKPDECVEILDENGYEISITIVLAIKLSSENNTKGLQEIAKVLGNNNINIEYIYSSMIKDESLLILRVDDNEKAKEILKKDGFIFEERESI